MKNKTDKSFFDTNEEPLTPLEATNNQSAMWRGNKGGLFSRINYNAPVIIVVVILGILCAGYFLMKKVVYNNDNTYEKKAQNEKSLKDDAHKIANSYLAIDPIIVNLISNIPNKNIYLRLTLTLRTESEASISILQAKIPMIVDTIQVLLRGMRAKDFENTANIISLKEELLKRVNLVTEPTVIKDILFKEIMIN